MPIADATFAAVAKEVAAARKALLALAQDEPDRWWTAFDLKTEARNGWSAGAMNLAFDDLVDSGAFDVDDDLRVRLRG